MYTSGPSRGCAVPPADGIYRRTHAARQLERGLLLAVAFLLADQELSPRLRIETNLLRAAGSSSPVPAGAVLVPFVRLQEQPLWAPWSWRGRGDDAGAHADCAVTVDSDRSRTIIATLPCPTSTSPGEPSASRSSRRVAEHYDHQGPGIKPRTPDPSTSPRSLKRAG